MVSVKVVLLLAGVVCQVAAAPQLLSAALSASGLGAFTGVASLATDTKTLGQALDLGGNITRFATHMVKNASESGRTVASFGLNHTTAFGSKALSGGIGVGKQALSLAESAAKHFPGGRVVNVISPMASAGLDVAGKVGGFGLNMTAKGGNKILDVGNRIVQHKAELVNTGAQKLIGVGRTAVNKMDAVKNSLNGLNSKLTSAASGLTSRAYSGLTSAASGLTSKLTSAASGLTSTAYSGLTSAASGLTSAISDGASSSGGATTSSGLKGRLTSFLG